MHSASGNAASHCETRAMSSSVKGCSASASRSHGCSVAIATRCKYHLADTFKRSSILSPATIARALQRECAARPQHERRWRRADSTTCTRPRRAPAASARSPRRAEPPAQRRQANLRCSEPAPSVWAKGHASRPYSRTRLHCQKTCRRRHSGDPSTSGDLLPPTREIRDPTSRCPRRHPHHHHTAPATQTNIATPNQRGNAAEERCADPNQAYF